MSNDPDDPLPLCPNNFLAEAILRDFGQMAKGEFSSHTQRFQFLDTLLDHFWRRFLVETIPSMHEANRLSKPETDLSVGDVVVLLEKDDRGVWPLARVVDVLAGRADGRVRIVQIRTAKGHYKRHVNALMRLAKA